MKRSTKFFIGSVTVTAASVALRLAGYPLDYVGVVLALVLTVEARILMAEEKTEALGNVIVAALEEFQRRVGKG